MTIEEAVFKLTKIQRIAILLAVSLLLLGLFGVFYAWDEWVRIEAIKKDIQRINNEIVSQENIKRQGPVLKAKIQKLKEELKEKVASLPEKQEIEDLLKKITDLLSENNLVASKFVPGKEQVNTELFYATIPISMSVRGDYQRQGNFLAALQGLPRIVNVPKLDLKKASALTGREKELASKLDLVSLDGEITGETYRRLTEQEIQDIAKQKQAAPNGARPAARPQ
jgi:Tfp pilus assembly protein PilO